MSQYVQPDIKIGQPGVVWLPNGQANEKPAPCAVNNVCQGRSISITIFHYNATFPTCKDGVCHFKDPGLKDRPENTAKQGAWAFFDELAPAAQSQQTHKHNVNPFAGDKVNATKTEEQMEAEVLEIHAQGGMNASEIATVVGNGITHQKVNAILVRNGRVQKGQAVSVS